MGYEDFKGLTGRTASYKILYGKPFNIAKNWKCEDIKGVLPQWFLNVLIKRLQLVLLNKELELAEINKELAEELHKPVIRKIKKRKVN